VALAKGSKRAKHFKTCKYRLYQPVCLRRTTEYERSYPVSLTRRAQHHIRGGNPTTLSFKGITRTYFRQIAVTCHVKFDDNKKLGSCIYATCCCVAENFAKLL